MSVSDKKRARLGPATDAIDSILGDDSPVNLLQPLKKTKGVLFPYTPDVTFGANANYGNFHFTHSNYQYLNYQNSAPTDIQITAMFTAQTNQEALYMLAALRFLRTSTMLEFGLEAARRGVAGTPPPVLRFNYLGQYMFNNVPVVVQSFNYTLERDVDYVSVQLPPGLGTNSGGGIKLDLPRNTGSNFDAAAGQSNLVYVPTRMMLVVTLQIQQNPEDVRDNFDLEAFKRGDLINKGYI